MNRLHVLAVAGVTLVCAASLGCRDRRAPNADEQGKHYLPSTPPPSSEIATIHEGPSGPAHQPASEHATPPPPAAKPAAVPSTAALDGDAVDIVGADGSRTPVHAKQAITSIQQKLQANNFYYGRADGTPSTDLIAAIRRFQQQHVLPQTGAIDRATAKALGLDFGTLAAAGESPAPEQAAPKAEEGAQGGDGHDPARPN